MRPLPGANPERPSLDLLTSADSSLQLPNIDPDTGVQHGSTPYKVTSKYRRSDPVSKYDPCFGVNAVPTQARGRLAVGDSVRIMTANSWVRQER